MRLDPAVSDGAELQGSRKGSDQTLNFELKDKNEPTQDAETQEEGSEVHRHGSENTEVDLWLGTKEMISYRDVSMCFTSNSSLVFSQPNCTTLLPAGDLSMPVPF